MECDPVVSPPGDGVEGGHSGHGHAQDGQHHSSGNDTQEQVAERVGYTGLRCFGDLGNHGSGHQSQTGEPSDAVFLASSAITMPQETYVRST